VGVRSLRGRLTLGITLVLAVVLAGAGIMTSRYVERSERSALDDFLQRTAALSRETSVAALEEGVPPPDRRLDNVLSASGTTLRLILGDVLIRESGATAPTQVLPKRDGLRTFTVKGRRYRAFVASVPVPNLGDLARFEVTTPLRRVEERLRELDQQLAAFGIAALLAGGFGTWLAATLLLRPLRRLRDATAGIAGTEDLDQRVPGAGPSELRSLARSFNDMLARLGRSAADRERALAATRRFTADAGHELRTPLTSVQATLSALSRHPNIPTEQRTEMVLDALSEHRRLVDLLDGLQAMARGDASPGTIGDIELGELVAAAFDQVSSRHPEVSWASSLPEEPVWTRGWEPGLRLLVDNLLINAARHGGGRVSVTLDPAGPELRVDDDGPGVAESERERIFEPFARVDGTTAPGSGLGLALVSQQVRTHGASIEVADSPLGGARFAVRFSP
jgi:two-component system sensor histidine kinase PrrB